MSHFVVYCILPAETKEDQIEVTVEKMLAPFSEHIEVEEYGTDCWCIGREARQDAIEQADQQLETSIKEIRDKYWATPEEERPDWESLIKPLQDLRKKLEEEHPLYQKPDHECEDCNGTGIRYTTYNPKSKWDWYVIGGRWHGYIRAEETNLDQYKDNVEKNINTTDNLLLLTNTPYAVLTENGEWHEKGEMGWFGMSSNEQSDEDWDKYYYKLLSAHPAHKVVAVDCHI